MKKIKKVMATLLAAALVLGSTMTAFAAEPIKQDNLNERTMDITVKYSKDNATTKPGNDDTKVDVYGIEIQYDEMNFEYAASEIKWDREKQDYVVTSNVVGSAQKGISVINKSNKAIVMTPSLNDTGVTKTDGIEYKLDLRRHNTDTDTETVLWEATHEAAAHEENNGEITLNVKGQDRLTVNMSEVVFKSNIDNFEPTKFASVSLNFVDPNPTTSSDGSTGTLTWIENTDNSYGGANIYRNNATGKTYIFDNGEDVSYEGVTTLVYFSTIDSGYGAGYYVGENKLFSLELYSDKEGKNVYYGSGETLTEYPRSAVKYATTGD